MAGEIFFGLCCVAVAMYVGLFEVAQAIRNRDVRVVLVKPITIQLSEDSHGSPP